MELKFIQQFEKKIVNLVLKNGFRYSGINFVINDVGLIKFRDRRGDWVYIEPTAIDLISPIESGGINENSV